MSDTYIPVALRREVRERAQNCCAVFQGQGVEIICTPFRAPKANAFAERWVRSVRAECLDQLMILNQRHLQQVLTKYIDYYNGSRPH